MITFNPSVSTSSNLKRTGVKAQKAVSFQRGFEQKELEKLSKTSSNTFNTVMTFIRVGVIRAQDGATQQIKAFEGKIHPSWYQRITEALASNHS